MRGVQLTPRSRDDMERAHAAVAETRKEVQRLTSPRGPTANQPWNIETVLDLGNTIFFHFRGRAYGIPPLPWHAGQKLQALWFEACKYPSPLTPETAPLYHKVLKQFPKILWKNCFPARRSLRILRMFGLLKNPFNQATEQELVDYANFFLSRRMRSGDSLSSVRSAVQRAEIA